MCCVFMDIGGCGLGRLVDFVWNDCGKIIGNLKVVEIYFKRGDIC